MESLMLKKLKERNFHIIIIAFIVGLFIGINSSFFASTSEPVHKYLDYFHKVYQLLRTDYVEKPNNKTMFYGAIKGMVHSLKDPFSKFLDKHEYTHLREIMTSKYVGIGVEITVRNKEITIVTPMEGSPAMKAGLKAGDIVKKVNGKSIRNKKFYDVIKLIKGKPGTYVKISIMRKHMNDLLDFNIKRMPIKIKSVSYSKIPKTNIGYIKIKVFNSETTRDFEKALLYLNKQNITKCILDLRNNPGGALIAANGVADLLLAKGKKIVSVKGRKGSGVYNEFISKKEPKFSGKIIILVNKGSASASEILSGAIRDNKRGKLLGVKTFGKGSVQKSYELDKKEQIGVKITIAKYYTPSGELIHKKGIQPDYKIQQMDKLSKPDLRKIRIIYKKRLIKKLMKKHDTYSESMKNQFKAVLDKHNIKLKDKIITYLLKSRYRLFNKMAFDLEFDKQLKTALKLLNDNKI